MWQRIKDWYQGETKIEVDHPAGLVYIVENRPLIAKAIVSLNRYWSKHWKWTIGILVALASVIVSVIGIIVSLNNTHTDQAALRPEYWQPLTSAQVSAIDARIQPVKPTSITIICTSNNCIALAESFAETFRRQGWAVKMEHHEIWDKGPNIRIFPFCEASQTIGKAIEEITGAEVTVSSKAGDQSNIVLYIGERLHT